MAGKGTKDSGSGGGGSGGGTTRRRGASGDGHIYQRKSGLWEAKITLPDGTRRSLYARSEREVRARKTALLHDLDHGIPIAPADHRQTLGTYLTSWLETKKPTIRPRPWKNHEVNARRHLIPGLGRTRLAQLTTQQVQALYAQKLAAGLAPRTIKNIHTTLRCALNEAIELGILHVNVAKRAKLPRVPKMERPIYTAEQVQVLLDTARGSRLEALYVLVITTGMRQGELLGLRWRDVNLDSGGYLYVRHNAQRVVGQGMVMFEPKTESGKRRIELPSVTVEALRAHRTRQLAERVAAGPGVWREGRDLVFCTGHGTPYRPGNFLAQQYVPLIARCGLPYIHFHDLRHTAATLMLESGVDILLVSQILGHSSVAVTLGLYGHVRPTQRRAGADAMDHLFGQYRRASPDSHRA